MPEPEVMTSLPASDSHRDGQLYSKLSPTSDLLSGTPIAWESPENHWRVAGGGISPSATYKSNQAARWLLYCRELLADKKDIQMMPVAVGYIVI